EPLTPDAARAASAASAAPAAPAAPAARAGRGRGGSPPARPPGPSRGPGSRPRARVHGRGPATPLTVRRLPRRRPPHPEPTWAITGGGAVSPLIASAHDQTTPHLPPLHRGGRGLGPGRR